jgi:hypothetical protein
MIHLHPDGSYVITIIQMTSTSAVLSGHETPLRINDLPPELLFQIATSLSLPDILRLGQTSSFFRRLFCSEDQTLWRHFYRRDLSTLRPLNDDKYQQAYVNYFRKTHGQSLNYQFDLATACGYEKRVFELITNGAGLQPKWVPSKKDCNYAMASAARQGYRDIVELMLQHVSGLHDSWFMIEAAEGGHRDIVELMLQRGATDYNGAMAAAARGGHRDIIDLMLQRGATDYDYALAKAAQGGHRDIVDLMFNLGATDYDSAMAKAAGGGHRDIVDLMLHRGAKDYNRAMAFAAEWGHPEIAKYLREHQRYH